MLRPRHRIRRLPAPDGNLSARGLAIFLDLDGTLVHIAEHPGAIAVDAELQRLLERLQRLCDGALALVSGRSIADLDSHLGPLAIAVAGQHGLERRAASGSRVELPGRELLGPARQAIEDLLRRHPGVAVEEKGLSLAVHYRRHPALASWLHRSLRALVAARPDGLALLRGKRVLEVKLSGADKGQAIRDFLADPPFRGRRPVFIGDDVTDEAGFIAVNALGGISVKVGAGATAATCRLPDVGSVLAWLEALKE